ncbi:MAG: disulfide bond formation protein B [Sphingorhabdus sp.]
MTFERLRWLALLMPAALLAGAYISQYVFGLYPCEMCWWQRWPHFAALAPAILAFMATGPAMQRMLVALAALAILTSGLIGAFHAGVEYGWWEGITGCATNDISDGNALENIMNAPLIRCDVAPWTLFGISLAGFNFFLSCGAAIAILTGIWRNVKN